MSEMITKNHALVAEFGDSLDRLLDGIENFMANNRPTLDSPSMPTDTCSPTNQKTGKPRKEATGSRNSTRGLSMKCSGIIPESAALLTMRTRFA